MTKKAATKKPSFKLTGTLVELGLDEDYEVSALNIKISGSPQLITTIPCTQAQAKAFSGHLYQKVTLVVEAM